ncbi:flagellar basal body rod protein FlgC [Virgibacillus halophilus]|uniref:Flagellar basal-body rod protein FlgC n=1 Tax=Tigheibacillus halophilus TaxID=361280 RepID=A0ABU5CBY2_9BACI|nr:flagellar basal body rod protein FlgC [Virgibacillus halophilus]
MSIFNSFNAASSALTAQRLRMDVISSNIANAETTRAEKNADGTFEPYRRKMVQLQADKPVFSKFLQDASANQASGVKVSSITKDDEPFKMVYNPSHPDADANGYVEMPNVDPLKEMVDLMSATRSYEANVTSLNATKAMLMKALEIGK